MWESPRRGTLRMASPNGRNRMVFINPYSWYRPRSGPFNLIHIILKLLRDMPMSTSKKPISAETRVLIKKLIRSGKRHETSLSNSQTDTNQGNQEGLGIHPFRLGEGNPQVLMLYPLFESPRSAITGPRLGLIVFPDVFIGNFRGRSPMGRNWGSFKGYVSESSLLSMSLWWQTVSVFG